MMTIPAPDVSAGLLDRLIERILDGPVLRAERIEAGRRRLARGPVDAASLATAMIAEVSERDTAV